VPGDEAGPARPDVLAGRFRLRTSASGEPHGVDAVTEQREDRRQQRDGREDRDEHDDGGRVAHSAKNGHSRDQKREQRDDDGPAGKHHRCARRGHGASDGFLNALAGVELVAVTEDDEQRVVDADTEPDHRRQRGSDVRDRDGVTEQADEAESGDQADQRGHDRHTGGG